SVLRAWGWPRGPPAAHQRSLLPRVTLACGREASSFSVPPSPAADRRLEEEAEGRSSPLRRAALGALPRVAARGDGYAIGVAGACLEDDCAAVRRAAVAALRRLAGRGDRHALAVAASRLGHAKASKGSENVDGVVFLVLGLRRQAFPAARPGLRLMPRALAAALLAAALRTGAARLGAAPAAAMIQLERQGANASSVDALLRHFGAVSPLFSKDSCTQMFDTKRRLGGAATPSDFVPGCTEVCNLVGKIKDYWQTGSMAEFACGHIRDYGCIWDAAGQTRPKTGADAGC
ncbi:unnamed protein product, partial [Prorocentrum cordatum]